MFGNPFFPLCNWAVAHTPDNSFMGFVSEELNETEKQLIKDGKASDMAVVYGKEASIWKVSPSRPTAVRHGSNTGHVTAKPHVLSVGRTHASAGHIHCTCHAYTSAGHTHSATRHAHCTAALGHVHASAGHTHCTWFYHSCEGPSHTIIGLAKPSQSRLKLQVWGCGSRMQLPLLRCSLQNRMYVLLMVPGGP